MRVGEIREREDFDSILAATLERGWSQQLGRPVHISAGGDEQGQAWRLQSTFSMLFVRGVSRQARRFMVKSLRFTPSVRRAPLQAAYATLAGTSPALDRMGRPLL